MSLGITAGRDTFSRADLRRLEPGLYRAGELLIRRLGEQRWVITFDGDNEPLWVRGMREFGSLTAASGMLADQRDLQRRAA